ncbi:unnamed protein product [Somion occarium]|uniref:Uncharacterized protein n=1 Tax=Somion occarium TaxID=3059160 RepID=A0ABP1DCB4_9APHY
MIPTRIFFALLASGLLQNVVAQTSLYIPGFDPQPISANEVGVGEDGRTTWQLQPGVTSGSFDDFGLIGTATLIQGPNDIQVIYNGAGLDLNENCAINGNLADCTVVAAVDGTTSTDFVTETVAPFEIQGGPALTSGGSVPSVTSSPTSGVPSGTSASGGSQAGSTPSGGASQTSAPPAGNTAPGDNSGAVKMGMSYLVWVASGVALLVLG